METKEIKINIPKGYKIATARQQAAVRYCEQWLCIEFEDNINSFDDCSLFLKTYLEDAKETERELTCEYEAYMWGD